MVKKIYRCLVLLTAVIAVACQGTDDVGIAKYGRQIDLSSSTLSDYQLTSALVYSTDGGTTFVGFPNLSKGQTYQAKVVYNPDPSTYTFPDEGSIEEITICPYKIDWSGSNPAPVSVDAATGIATFVAGSDDNVKVTVTNLPFDAAEAAGTYEVVTDDWVDFHPGDLLTVEKIDDTHIRIVEYPNTGVNHAPLVITIDDLATGDATVKAEDNDNGAYSDPADDETITSGSGTLSSCAGSISLDLSFDVAGGTYSGNALVLQKQ